MQLTVARRPECESWVLAAVLIALTVAAIDVQPDRASARPHVHKKCPKVRTGLLEGLLQGWLALLHETGHGLRLPRRNL